jgi:hypothetical protein
MIDDRPVGTSTPCSDSALSLTTACFSLNTRRKSIMTHVSHGCEYDYSFHAVQPHPFVDSYLPTSEDAFVTSSRSRVVSIGADSGDTLSMDCISSAEELRLMEEDEMEPIPRRGVSSDRNESAIQSFRFSLGTNTRHFCSDPPRIIVPNANDVLCGKGGKTVDHNLHYTRLCVQVANDYATTKQRGWSGKKGVALSVVQAIQLSGGRFLKPSAGGKGWDVLSEEKCIDKAAHCIRDVIHRHRRPMHRRMGD